MNESSIVSGSKSINVVHASASISLLGAGVSEAIRGLCRYGQNVGIVPTVVSFGDPDRREEYAPLPEATVYLAPFSRPRILKVSKEYENVLQGLNRVDIVHAHGLWMLNGLYARRYARKSMLPFILSPHGMLEPWSLQRSRWKKTVAAHLYENENIHSANCLHAASEQEAQNIRTAGFKNPIAVIPFGQEIRGTADIELLNHFRSRFPQLVEQKIILFLSRLHPKKGLDRLILAWSELFPAYPEWHLLIAGSDEGSYRRVVEKLIQEKGIDGRTTLAGPLYGKDKDSAFAAADLFVLPSHSENFGIVVAEALAAECPVITTKGAPWQKISEYGCGWWIEVGVDPLRKALVEGLSLSDGERSSMGERGRKLILSQYSWNVAAQSFKEVYFWLLKAGNKPNCVVSS